MNYQIKVASNAFLTALKKTKPAIPSNPVLQTLECVLISTEENTLSIVGTTLEMWITNNVIAECENGISFLADIKKLIKLCETLPIAPLLIAYDSVNNQITMSCDGATFTLGTENVEEYPKMPDIGEVLTQKDLDGNILLDCSNAIKFTSGDPLRPALTGVYFDYSGKYLNIVATDAHCLFVSDKYTGECQRDFLVPANCLKVVCSQAKKTNGTISFTNTHCVYENKEMVILIRLIDTKYPHYKDIIPLDKSYFSIGKQTLLAAVNSMLPFANQTTKHINFELNGSLKIEAEDLDFNTSSSKEIPFRFKNTTDFFFAFNGEIFSKAISCIDANNIKIYNDGNPSKAFTLRSNDSDALILIMPLLTNAA